MPASTVPNRPPVMPRLFRALHEHLIDAIQSGRASDAYDLARLLAYVGPRQ